MNACLNADVPEPVFRYEQTGLWVEFPFTKLSDKQKTEDTPQEDDGRNDGKNTRNDSANP